MKRTFLILLILSNFSLVKADKGVNVLRYYAVDNSLDGQPAVDRVNVLRFYPVFAMQDSIYSVQVTIYYGANRFTRNAESMNMRKYWQVLLPKFKLGEAIQRLEVEVHFHLTKSFIERYNFIKDREDGAARQIEDRRKAFKRDFAQRIIESNKEFIKLGLEQKDAGRLTSLYQKNIREYLKIRDELIDALPRDKRSADLAVTIDSLMEIRIGNLGAYKTQFKELNTLASDRNRLHDDLTKEIEVGLADTLYSGPSIKKSDIIITGDEEHHRPVAAKILYRNYKKSLRRLQALDPVERMGIFRVRYVPFPVIGTGEDLGMKLLAPLQSSSPTVFEIGLSFGDAIVPGDEFVVPSFSIDRLGVAFAITEKLFDDDAEVRALVLTYDFNSYGSLGIGANFPGDKIRTYFSLGINKRAFENALAGIAKLFQ